MPQCAGGGVVNGSPTPLWQKNVGSPILLACNEQRKNGKINLKNCIIRMSFYCFVFRLLLLQIGKKEEKKMHRVKQLECNKRHTENRTTPKVHLNRMNTKKHCKVYFFLIKKRNRRE